MIKRLVGNPFCCGVCGCEDSSVPETKTLCRFSMCPCCHCIGFPAGYVFEKDISEYGDFSSNSKSPYFRKWKR